MNRYFGSIVFALLLVLTLVPLGSAGPTRATEPVVAGITVDGLTAPGGEYATGAHVITAVMGNLGDTWDLVQMNFTLEVRYQSNDTLFYTDDIDGIWVELDPLKTNNATLGSVVFPEGSFNITVITEYEEQAVVGWKWITVEDIVDLTLYVSNPMEGASFSPGVNIVPMCDVMYDGNIESWLEDVSINLKISMDAVVIYDQTVIVMEKIGGAPQDPPYTFSNIAFPSWITGDAGAVTFSFALSPIDGNPDGNYVEFQIAVEQRPSIEGVVTSGLDVPLEGVLVEIWLGLSYLDSTFTDADGNYQFDGLAPANYTLKFSKTWATPEERYALVLLGQTATVDVEMDLLDQGSLNGYVYLPGDMPAQDATVTATLIGGPVETTMTDADGSYDFPTLASGVYNVSAELTGYVSVFEETTVFAQMANRLDLDLGLIDFTVVGIQPPDGELSFPVWEEVTLEFSRPLDNETIDNIVLLDEGTSIMVDVLYNLSEDLKTVQLDPVEELDYGVEYEIRVGQFLKDINGNFFPTVFTSMFTTEAMMQEVTVIGITPTNNQASVPVGAIIKAVFSHPLDPLSVNTSTFRVLKGTVSPVPIAGTVVYYPGNMTVIFTPAGGLDYGTRYRIDISNEIRPLYEDMYFEGQSYIFQTITQVTTGSISGKVLDPDNMPYLSADVLVRISKGNVVDSKNPTQDGSFNFQDVSPGVWNLTVLVKGKEKFKTTVTVVAGQQRTVGDIKIAEDEDKDDYTLLIILIVIIILVIIGVIVFLVTRKKEEGGEEPSRYGRRYGGYGGYGYDEMAPGEFMCPNCMTVVGPEEDICPGCGEEFEPDLFECPECGATIPGDIPKCPECGAEFEYEPGEEEEDIYAESDEEKEIDISHEYEVSPMEDEPEFRGMIED